MREPLTPADTGPRPVQESLDRLSRAVGGPSATVLGRVFAEWADLVGTAVSAHAHPMSMRDGALVVSVDDAAWGTEIRYRCAELLSQMTARLGPGAPTRLEVRVRPRGARGRDPSVVE